MAFFSSHMALLRGGDWLILALAGIGIVVSFMVFWQGGAPERAIIRLDGRVFQEVPLDRPRRIVVPGTLGETIIEVEPGRAKVAADPGIRQYCVRQGWLARAGAIAVCAPNRVSLAIMGKEAIYDSLNY
jgi:hypothetical protein